MRNSLTVIDGGNRYNEMKKVFNYGESRVRTVIIDGNPWFVAKDVCDILGIVNHKDAVSRLNNSMKDGVGIADPIGRMQVTTIISEAGVYKLIFQSRKPEAEKFADWVASEVLPAIRKTGMYSVEQRRLPRNYKEALQELLIEVEKNEILERENKMLAPMAENYRYFLEGEAMDIEQVAKALNFKGVGRNKLFAILRGWKHLTGGKSGYKNLPMQQYVDAGYYEVIWKTVEIFGEVKNIPKTLVTPKGVEHIKNRLLREGYQMQKKISELLAVAKISVTRI